MEKQVSRIRKMERRFNRVSKSVAALQHSLASLEALSDDIAELERYMSSGQWKEDFEADERGEFPEGLLRGVLSEDGLYNLLEAVDNLNNSK